MPVRRRSERHHKTMNYSYTCISLRGPVPRPCIVLLVAMLAGCPDDYQGGHGNDEVGDGDGTGDGGGVIDSDPKPMDPLAGATMTATCAEQSSHIGSNSAPASLGNGLVHDARL